MRIGESNTCQSNTKPEYKIDPALMTDTGPYTCEGVRRSGSQLCKASGAVKLTVSGKALPVDLIAVRWKRESVKIREKRSN